MHHKAFGCRAPPGPAGKLTEFSRPPSWICGVGPGPGWEGMEGEGREGNEGKEGRERKGRNTVFCTQIPPLLCHAYSSCVCVCVGV